jgi:translation initiation factor IF-2
VAGWPGAFAPCSTSNEQLTEAGPSVPVEIRARRAPSPGDPLAVVETEARARELTEYRDA